MPREVNLMPNGAKKGNAIFGIGRFPESQHKGGIISDDHKHEFNTQVDDKMRVGGIFFI